MRKIASDPIVRTARIMTYNVHRCVGSDRRVDPHRIAEIIAACEPDIVALQELDVARLRTGGIDQADAIANYLGMSFHFHPAVRVEEELYGDAILTALPMRVIKAKALPGSLRLEPRGALWVAVAAGGVEIQIINTHLGLSPYERLVQARCLVSDEWLCHPDCREPVFLVGDFNAIRRSRAYRLLTSRLRDVQLGGGGRPKPTFPARMPLLRIDHIFCSKSIEVLDVQTVRTALARLASDHLPLVADVRLSSNRSKVSEKEPRRHGLHASAGPSGSPR